MSQRPSVFPSILPDTDEPFVDNSYSRAELERMDGNELQSLAAEYPSDEINGRTKADEITDYLEGRERL